MKFCACCGDLIEGKIYYNEFDDELCFECYDISMGAEIVAES